MTQPIVDVVIPCFDRTHLDATLNTVRAQTVECAVHVVFNYGTGASQARNKGAALGSAEWVTFLDADDLLATDRLEAALDEIGDADGGWCSFIYCGDTWGTGPLIDDPIETLRAEGYGPATSRLLVRRSRLVDWRPVPAAQDGWFVLDLLAQGRVLVPTPSAWVAYRVWECQVSRDEHVLAEEREHVVAAARQLFQ